MIASLNGVTPEGWTDYARAMQDAGAAAIELNIYYLPGDPHTSGRDVEQRHIDILERVKDAVTVPVAVKLSPYFSSTGEMALRLDEAGADALVLFNRFLQPDIDPEELALSSTVALSSPADARLPRTWIALLRGRVRAALAATGGVEGPADVAKYLLAGADVVMTASALLRHGPEYASDAARRAVDLDGAQGIPIRRRAARHARRAARAPTRRHTSARATSARCARPTPAPTAPGRRRERRRANDSRHFATPALLRPSSFPPKPRRLPDAVRIDRRFNSVTGGQQDRGLHVLQQAITDGFVKELDLARRIVHAELVREQLEALDLPAVVASDLDLADEVIGALIHAFPPHSTGRGGRSAAAVDATPMRARRRQQMSVDCLRVYPHPARSSLGRGAVGLASCCGAHPRGERRDPADQVAAVSISSAAWSASSVSS